jgi:hypothetical protein
VKRLLCSVRLPTFSKIRTLKKPVILRNWLVRQCKSHLLRVEARLHQRWVASTQRYFTTLDQRRTLGTPKDCGLADWRPAALLRTSPNSQTPRCCDKIRCFPPLKTLLHQYSGPLAAEHGAILPLWLSIAFFTRSKTVIGADLRSCSPSTPWRLSNITFWWAGQPEYAAISQCWISVASCARPKTVVGADYGRGVAPNIVAPSDVETAACYDEASVWLRGWI